MIGLGGSKLDDEGQRHHVGFRAAAGQLNAYYIVDRVGTQVIYDPIIRSTGNNRPTGQAGWFGFWRVGADVADPGQFKLLRLHTTATAVPLA
jgi:predicted phage gp36 major capsid-like protein